MTADVGTLVTLESGDHLRRSEFHARYCARPDLKKAELVEGVVYVASPVRFSVHGQQHGHVMTWLGTYAARTPGLLLGDNATVILDDSNEVQPDACLWHPQLDGPNLDSNGYIQGPPQLVVEIAASSASYDLHEKKEAYRRHGVREYVVWRVLDGALDWFRFIDGGYTLITPGADGVIESSEFPGLRLIVVAMLAGNVAAVLDALNPPEA